MYENVILFQAHDLAFANDKAKKNFIYFENTISHGITCNIFQILDLIL